MYLSQQDRDGGKETQSRGADCGVRGCISQKGQRRELEMGDGMIRALIHIKGEVHYNCSVWPLGLVQTSVLSS